MRLGVCVLMMVLTLLSGFERALIVAHFSANQAKLAAAFCINTDRPGLPCHGRCHLRKKLQQSDENESASAHRYPEPDVLTIVLLQLPIARSAKDVGPPLAAYLEQVYSAPYPEIIVPPPNGLQQSQTLSAEMKQLI